MPNYVGIDLGSHFIKGASVVSPSEPAQPIRFALNAGYTDLPFVARVGDPNGARWAQYLARRSDFSVAFAFRDRLRETSSSMMVGGKARTAARLFTLVLGGIRESILAAVPDVTSLGLSVPDHWEPGNWTLAQSFVEDGWESVFLARESVAALTHALSESTLKVGENVLLLSLGAGGVSGTVVTRTGGGEWRPLLKVRREDVSGAGLRELLVNAIAREIVFKVRKDPTEVAAVDQRLHDAVEQLLRLLEQNEAADFQAELFGDNVTLPFSRTRVGELAAPIAERFRAFTDDLRKQLSDRGPIDNVLFWGDLAARLPVAEWLTRDFPRAEVKPLHSHCVACGMARLLSMVVEKRLLLTADSCVALDNQTGQYVPSFGGEWRSGGPFPLLEFLPGTDASPAAAGGAPQPRLVRLDGEIPTVTPIDDALRLGRDPQSHVIIETNFDQVSRAHAVIQRKGTLFILSDLGSTNGTFVDGKLIHEPISLHSGVEIVLGINGPRFRFENS